MAFVQATTGFMTQYGGVEVHIVEGEILDSNHEIVRNTPKDWWAPIQSRFAAAPEEATTKRKRPTPADESE